MHASVEIASCICLSSTFKVDENKTRKQLPVFQSTCSLDHIWNDGRIRADDGDENGALHLFVLL